MLQREPALNPDHVRHLLLTSARDPGSKARNSVFGAGLADAYGALVAENPPLAEAAPVERLSTRR